MMHVPTSDFVMASLIDAEHRAKAEKLDAENRVTERIEKGFAQDREAAADFQTALGLILVAVVGPAEMQRIAERLAEHQEAVIEALQDNRDELDTSEERLEDLLGQAHVLEDGRRVFKTEDGLRVFDESGVELSPATVDARDIEEWRPRAETYLDELDDNVALRQQQQELLDYQSRLDAARTWIDEGSNLTQDEYDDLSDLLDNAPMAVRTRLESSDPAYVSNRMPAEPISISETLDPDEPLPGLGQ